MHPLSSLKFHFGYLLRQSSRFVWLKFCWGNHMSVLEWMIHMIFTTEGFFKVAIESGYKRDLNLRPQNSVQTLYLTEQWDHEFNSHSETFLYSYFSFILGAVPSVILAIAFLTRDVCFGWNFLGINTWV